MSEEIVKFQPDRSMYFRGFSGIQCPASMHSASSTGFTISGVWRDPADFWVLVIYDVDDFFHHPRLKALPAVGIQGSGARNLKGVVLEFDVEYQYTDGSPASASLDVPKYPTIGWPFLEFIRNDGSTGRVDLSYGNVQTQFTGTTSSQNTIQNNNPTTLASGSLAAASGAFVITSGGASYGDKLTIFFENYYWSYGASGGGADTPLNVATYLAGQINATVWGDNIYTLTASVSGSNLVVTANAPGADGNMIRLYAVSTDAANLYVTPNPLQLSGGSSSGAVFHVKLDFSNLVDFYGNPIDDLRQAWLTFAPQLVDSGPYIDPGAGNNGTTADIVFTNWGITADPNVLSAQKVAGPGSVRIEESDAWVNAAGAWNKTNVGWFSQGFAIYSNTIGDSITITYWSQFTHDLWVGTSLYSDRGKFGVTVDGAAQPDLDMMTVTYPAGYASTPSSGSAISEAVSTRRQIATGIAAGKHTVVLTVKAGDTPPSGITTSGYCYFDFLEAAVASDVPDPQGSWTDRAPAIDYDTQHGYQLAPQRLLWMMQKLGFAGGPIDEYVGVFWWNQRTNTTQDISSARVDFSSVTLTAGDSILFRVGSSSTFGYYTEIGKSFFSGDSAASVAAHFQYFINETFSGIWAFASGSALTITARSPAEAYQNAYLFFYLNSISNPISYTGSLNNGIASSLLATPTQLGTWLVDPAQSPALNYGAEQWHADLYATAKALGTSVVSAFSLEIVQPPDSATTAAAGTVGAANAWACRFADGNVVATSTGFGSLNSTQCVPMAAPFLAYQKAAFMHLADLQTAAGLPVQLQCGEHLWWFFQEGGPFAGATGMAYYDDATRAAAAATLGRALHLFLTPNDDPSVNGYADANFLAARLNGHVAAIINTVQATYPDAQFEILWPADVNGSVQTPISAVGGKLNAYVSFPIQWQAESTAPFQFFKLEYLAFLTSDRSMNFVQTALSNMAALNWPSSKVRVLYTVDNPGVAQWRDYLAIKAKGFTNLTPWAFDQINLIGWDVEPPATDVTAQIL